MKEQAFRSYMIAEGLSLGTVSTRCSALRRIERAEGIDLDEAFDADGLHGLKEKYSYSTGDQREGRSNPSAIDIEPENTYKFLAFFRSALSSYQRFRGGGSFEDQPGSSLPETASAEVAAETAGKTFALERDLQNALRSDIGQLEAGLEIVDGGREVQVEAGFIDILAKDRFGKLTVIELKAEVGRPAVIAQILAYMASLQAERREDVRGIIVAADFDPRVELASRAVPNLTLKRYKYRFDFS